MSGDVQELHEGRWRPAVPLPFYGFLHVRCYECGRRFWPYTYTGRKKNQAAYRRYERHYRASHI